MFTIDMAVRLWEDTVGDSGEAPTDRELAIFANAVLKTIEKGFHNGQTT